MPSGYKLMPVEVNIYRATSIKSSEREKQGSSSKIFIKSVSPTIPQKFPKVLQSDCNKTRLKELLLEFI